MQTGICYRIFLESYKNRNVFITGHTGFKGSWLTSVLLQAGANVTGYSLQPPTEPSLFRLAEIDKNTNLTHIIGDVRDFDSLHKAIESSKPDYIIHLAAQPIVRESYTNPRMTYETNVMGTVNLMEAVRKYSAENKRKLISVLNVTTDKVYENKEWCWGYRENEPLDGYDPYSNSKSCSELVTHSYKNSFFDGTNVRVSTARAGNVIGGGDFASDRIIPDCIRAIKKAYDNHEEKGAMGLRNPYSIRPYQHVLDPVFAYLMIMEKQYKDVSYCGYYNVGPGEDSCISTGELVKLFSQKWNEVKRNMELSSRRFPELEIIEKIDPDPPHESQFLKLDCSKLKRMFDWKPRWEIEEALDMTVRFISNMILENSLTEEMNNEIKEFIS